MRNDIRKTGRGGAPARLRPWLCAVLCGLAAHAAAGDNRWVFIHARGLLDDKELLFASNVVVRAAAAGLEGLVWPGGLDTCWTWPEDRRARFAELLRIVRTNGMDIVPLVWSTGYGTMTGVDLGLIESTPLRNVPYVARGGRLVPDCGGAELVENGGFEEPGRATGTFRGWFTDHPGLEAFTDTETFRSGGASLRMEPAPEKDEHGHARASQHVALEPNRFYRVSAWFKVRGFDTSNEKLMLHVYLDGTSPSGGSDAGTTVYGLADEDGWREASFSFSTGDATGATIWCGAWGAKSGTFWIDDVSLREAPLTELARREDSPRTVRSAADPDRVYERGKDWLDPDWRTRRRGEPATFPIPDGSAIAEGERVLLDTYVVSRSAPKMQTSTCMSDPRLYELFERSAREIEALLHPDRWFLSLDEIRNGGTCPLCSARETDMAHILGDCVRRQCEIIRAVHPGAEIYAWSDMFDPNHNAHDHFYRCKGTFEGVWDLIPKDVTMVCWHRAPLSKTLPFFDEHGFPVMASVCCDDRGPDEIVRWKQAMDAAPGPTRGFQYTTWTKDYSRLEEFARTLWGDAPDAPRP
jgi:hypothetical protein